MKLSQLLSRKALRVFTLLVLALGLPAQGHGSESAKAKALFQNPPRGYSTGPLWVWNDMLTESQIRETLRDLAGQEVKQVWVHPRPGLMTPYLSADWFRLWKIALQEAERLDLNVWIYDENSYPSGFAGGLVPEAMPESRGRGLTLKESSTAPKWSDNLIGVYRLEQETFENVTARIKTGDSLPGGRYLTASEVRAKDSPWNGNRCYVNLLSPGVTEKFLELTMEPYRAELGAQFGKRVPGVFTDEPNIRPAGGLPWSEVLAAEFQKRWGYDLLDHLPSLTQPVGDWRKIRHNYFQLLNDQFVEHWARPYHDYCETNHLEWTGHYWDHEWPNCAGVPDNMAMYAWHQRPAIDCLMNQYSESTHGQFGNARMPRELSSVANQLGRTRTLCEVYGAGGWDLRFEDMKRIGDWLEVLGVNTLNQHLSYVTIRGARKRDHPQSFSYHEPWWPAYHTSAQYFSRVSAALSQGEQINRILVLEPTTTAWMYQGDNPRLQKLGDSFFKLIMALEAAQVEYDIGSEDVLARHGSVRPSTHSPVFIQTGTVRISAAAQGAELRVGRRTYSKILIPAQTENLNAKTAQLLEQFVQPRVGGEVLCLTEPPARVEGVPSNQVLQLTNNPCWKSVELNVIQDLAPQAIGVAGFAIRRAADDKGILFHHRRELWDGQLVFLVNSSIVAPSKGTIESNLAGVEKWNLDTGEVERYPFAASGCSVQADFELPPSGSLLLFLSRKPLKPAPAQTLLTSTLQPVKGPEVHRVEPNILTLDFVDITAGGETKTDIYFYQANQFAWRKNGMDRNPWDSAVQFKDELISKKFPADSGFEASYKFTIEGAVPANLVIVIERPDLYAITCNGQPLSAPTNSWWLDKAFGRLPIAAAARTGENIVAIKAAPFTMFHELEPAYVLGNFSLKPADKGFVISPEWPLTLGKASFASAAAGSAVLGADRIGWNGQGHPFYSAGVTYREEFNLSRPKGRYSLVLSDWYGSVAEVTVNGRRAGFITAPPWSSDITRHIKRGVNQVEVKVIGTLKNTLGPHHGNPALGAAWPSAFQKGPASGPPPGNLYSTVAYGVFEPFVLQQTISE